MTEDSKIHSITSAKRNKKNLNYTLINYGKCMENPYLLIISSDDGIELKSFKDLSSFSPNIIEKMLKESDRYLTEEVDPFINYYLSKYGIQ